jgi:L-arabinonolactonase
MQQVGQISAGCSLGEGIVWDGKRVWWTDIEGRSLYSCTWPTAELRRFVLPHRLCSFGLVRDSTLLVGAFETGFALLHPDDTQVGDLLRPEGLVKGLRLNDGRVDPRGRFWAGSMAESAAASGTAQLYSVGNGIIRTHERGLGIANGLCWSPGFEWLYLADSAKRVIWRYAYDAEAGTISGRTEFARTRGKACPDGAAVDTTGCIWSAVWGGSAVVRYTPAGRIDQMLELPVSQPTCVCFGGEDLDLLFVTTACTGLDDDAVASEAGAGDVLVYNVGAQGMPEQQFDLDGWPSAGESEG